MRHAVFMRLSPYGSAFRFQNTRGGALLQWYDEASLWCAAQCGICATAQCRRQIVSVVTLYGSAF